MFNAMKHHTDSDCDDTSCTSYERMLSPPQSSLLVKTPCAPPKYLARRRSSSPRNRLRHSATCTTTFVTSTGHHFMLVTITVVSMLYMMWGWRITTVLLQPWAIPVDAFGRQPHVAPPAQPIIVNTVLLTSMLKRQRYLHNPVSPVRWISSPSPRYSTITIHSNVAIKPESTEVISDNSDEALDVDSHIDNDNDDSQPDSKSSTIFTSEEVKLRMEKQLERLKLKDRMSPKLSKEEIDIVYEDDHLMIVNKPAGVLTVAGKEKTNNSFVQAVYDHYRTSHNIQLSQADHMVVHRLGMDVSGLMILAKNVDTIRRLHTHFRTRNVERTYEALVCGHVVKNKGRITLPLMRDYEHPLYVRVSTDQHQEVLIDLDPDIVGKKILEQPKECITEYKVLAREELNGQPVTRLLLRSVSGRMHQLNCHLAAIGHPIVGDLSYGGINGMAAPNGGLSDDELDYMIPKAFSLQSQNRVTTEQQLRTATGNPDETSMTHVACHAKILRFRHPMTKKYVTFEADAPF